MEKDFQEELKSQYSPEEVHQFNNWIESILCDNTYYRDYKYPESDKYEFSLEIEKHDALNFTYFIEIYNDNESINCTFYTGVNVGCELTEYSVNDNDFCSSKYDDAEYEELIDVELDIEKTTEYIRNKPNAIKNVPNEFFKEMLLKKAQILLENKKEEIMKIYSNQNYDDYMTGGGTSKTDDYYKQLKRELNELGCYWKCVYQTVICDRNLR